MHSCACSHGTGQGTVAPLRHSHHAQLCLEGTKVPFWLHTGAQCPHNTAHTGHGDGTVCIPGSERACSNICNGIRHFCCIPLQCYAHAGSGCRACVRGGMLRPLQWARHCLPSLQRLQKCGAASLDIKLHPCCSPCLVHGVVMASSLRCRVSKPSDAHIRCHFAPCPGCRLSHALCGLADRFA